MHNDSSTASQLSSNCDSSTAKSSCTAIHPPRIVSTVNNTISSGVGPGRCRPETTQANFRSQPRQMSSTIGPGQFRTESIRADVKRRRPGPMLSGVDSGRCQSKLVQADVDWSRPGLLSSKLDPYRCRLESA